MRDIEKWFAWLKQQFDDAEERSKQWAKEEIERAIISDDLDKWKIRVRLYSNSHTIKQSQLNQFNSWSKYVKLYSVDKNKNALDVEYTLPKSVHVSHLYWAGWGFIRKFVTALNIGSLGYFWWYLPVQTSKYYHKLVDLEKNCDVVVERTPALTINWQKDKLMDVDLRNTALCIGLMPGPSEKQKLEPFNMYLTGLMFLSKTDIHYQFEIDAYRCFFESLKEGIKIYEPLKVSKTYEETFKCILNEIIPKFDETEKYFNLGQQIQERKFKNCKVTLEEVGMMKAICDIYFITIFRKMRKENEDPRQ